MNVEQNVFLALLLALLAPTSAGAGWQATFADEFDGASVDATKWQTLDSFGTETYSGGGVPEAQCYQDAARSMANGILTLTATAKTFTACRAAVDLSKIQYQSGRITSFGKFSQLYGYFEARMKLPAGAGLWPAFWLLPNVGYPPEIDIMEWVGKDPLNAHATYHWNPGTCCSAKGFPVRSAVSWAQDWHRFGVDWQKDLLIWYYDGKEVARLANNGYFPSTPMYLLVNLALGGSWGGAVDASAIPARLQLDYIRVWQRVADGRPDTLPPTVAAASIDLAALQRDLATVRRDAVDLLGLVTRQLEALKAAGVE